MNSFELSRRDVVRLAAGSAVAAGTASTAGAATDASSGSDPFESVVDPAIENGSFDATDVERVEYVLDHVDSDFEATVGAYDDVDWADLPAGGYEVRERRITDEAIVETVRYTGNDPSAVGLTATDVEINAFFGPLSNDATIEAGETATLFVGAVDESGLVPEPADGIDVDIEIEDPDGETESVSATIEDGIYRHDVDTDADLTGSYDATIEHDDSWADQASIHVGPTPRLPYPTGSVAPGREFEIPIVSRAGDTPAANQSVSVDVTYPDGETDTIERETGEDGIATVALTADEVGTVNFDVEAGTSRSVSIAEHKVFIDQFRYRDQRAGEEATISGQLRDEDGPVSDTEFVVVIEDETDFSDPEEVLEDTVTSDEHGLFEFSWETPDDEEIRYVYSFETTDGDPIRPHDGYVETNVVDDEEITDPGLDVSASFEEGSVEPDGEATLGVSVTDGGEPVSDQTVEVAIGFEFQFVPFETVELETDADGEATHAVSLPDWTPDGAQIRSHAGVESDEETDTNTAFLDVQRYEFGRSSGPDAPGEETTVEVTTTDTDDEPVADVANQLFVSRRDTDYGLVETTLIETDEDGAGEASFTLPADLQDSYRSNFVNAYHEISRRAIMTVDRFDVEVDGADWSDDPVAPGETREVRALDTDGDELPALVVFEDFQTNRFLSGIARPGEPAEITVPDDQPESSFNGNVYAVDDEGNLQSAHASLDVQPGIEVDVDVSTTTPDVGEEVTFDASGTESSVAEVDTIEWDFTGDGTFDETGETVTYAYEESGEYTAVVRVEDTAGNVRTEEFEISVEDPDDEPDPSAADYAGEDGQVGIGGTLEAIDDYRGGDIGVGLVLEVIGAYNSGEPVE